MQMAVIECARNQVRLNDVGSSEFGSYENPVVGLMTEWLKGDALETRTASGDLGGTLRLGAYDCALKAGSRVREIYGSDVISERHRHRYEVNMDYRPVLEKAGIVGPANGSKARDVLCLDENDLQMRMSSLKD
jgi:CTP synthase